jgi:hypothetical protein
MQKTSRERVKARCAACQAGFRVPPAAIGKRGRCPKCGEVFVLTPAPNSAASPTRPAQAGGRVRFPCPQCAASLKVPAQAAGRRVRCKGCGAVVTVPGEKAPAPPITSLPGADDDLLSGLAAGQVVEAPAEARARSGASPAVRPCPACGVALSGNAVLCTTCGYNLQTGRTAGPSAVGEAARGALGAVGGLATLGGRFTRGCLGSAIGAMIGAGIWSGVAHATQYEIGWIAWAVGALAGMGMYLGYGQAGAGAGLVAAGMSVAGIVAAKLVMFLTIVGPALSMDFDNSEPPREQLAALMAAEIAREPDLPEEASEEEWYAAFDAEFDAALERTRPKVDELSDQQVEQRLAENRQRVRAELRRYARSAFFSASFGWMDLLFFGLAILTAFKIGAGGIAASED